MVIATSLLAVLLAALAVAVVMRYRYKPRHGKRARKNPPQDAG